MKNRTWRVGILGLALVFGLAFIGCDNGSGGGTSKVTVTFNRNGATGTVPAEMTVNKGSRITIPDAGGLTLADHAFDGWNTERNGSGNSYYDGDSMTVNQDTTLYAQWKQNTPVVGPFTASTNNNTSNDVATLGLVGTTASSSNPSVATAAITGGRIEITSTAAGTATITVRNAAGNEAQISVTVDTNGAITIGTITKNNPLIGSWAFPNSDAPTEVALFTGTRAYFSAQIVRRPRQGNLDTGANTIKLAGIGSEYTYDYELTSTTLTIKKVIDDTEDAVLRRREGSTNTGLEDVWISSSLSTARQTFLLIIRASGSGNDILYNWEYGSWWRTDTYTIDSAGDIRWDNWSTTPTSFSFSEAGDLTIRFPALDYYAAQDIRFVKTTWF